MITTIKRKDLPKLVKEGIDGNPIYYALDQAADKIRAIYVLFGWNQAKDEMFDTHDKLIDLTKHCMQCLIDRPKESEAIVSSGGMSVNIWEEKGFDVLQMSVSFNIIA